MFSQQVLGPLLGAIPRLLLAIVLLALGIIFGILVSTVVVKLGRHFGLDKKLEKWNLGGKSESTLQVIGKILGLLVFILFLPGVLSNLGLGAVSDPVSGMINQFLSYIPNILGAAVIVVVGLFAAKIIKNIIIGVLGRTKLDAAQEKHLHTGDAVESAKFSVIIGNIVYVFILIPILIAALDVLKIASISTPAVSMLGSIFAVLPSIFVAIVLMIIGVFVAKLVYSLLFGLLSGIGTDRFLQRFLSDEQKTKSVSLSKIISEIVRVVIIVMFAVQAITVVHLGVLTTIGSALVSFLPSLIFAAVILIAAYLLGLWVQSLVGKATGSKTGGAVVKWVILALAVFIALNQLGFAMWILNAAFIVILAAVAIAFAVSFGVGGRGFAAKVLSRWDTKMSGSKNDEPKADTQDATQETEEKKDSD